MMNELQSVTLSSHEVVKQEASLHILLTLSKQECNSRASLMFLCQWIAQIIKPEISRIITLQQHSDSAI